MRSKKMSLNALHLTWTPVIMFLIVLAVPCWGLEMQWVPTSISVFVGENTAIPCNFHQKHDETVAVSWVFINKNRNKTHVSYMQKNLLYATQNLTINNVKKNDSGLYLCSVTVRNKTQKSCGTYLRVKELPVYLFFNVADGTKNRLITAEGIILLLCAIIPGTFLLYKRCQQAEAHKRIWEVYFTTGKANNNDYTSLTDVQLLTIQGPHTAV